MYYTEIDIQRSHTCTYFHLDLDPHCETRAVCETAFRLYSRTRILPVAMVTSYHFYFNDTIILKFFN